MHKLLLASSFFCFAVTGCASHDYSAMLSPLHNTSWEGKVVSRDFSVSHKEIVDQIRSRIIKKNLDNIETLFVNNYIDTHVPESQIVTYKDNSDCSSKMRFLDKKMEFMISRLQESVKYELGWGVYKRPISTWRIHTLLDEGNARIQQLDKTFKWGPPGNEVGNVKLNIQRKIACDNKRDISFRVTLSDYSIKDSGFARILVDANETRKILDSIKQEYVFSDQYACYRDNIREIAGHINKQLSYRYSTKPVQTIKAPEHLYKVSYDTVLSRLQRKLNSYRFSNDKTRYEYQENIQVVGRNVLLKTVARIFPEEGGKTAIAFNLEFTPIYDEIAQKYLFGEVEAHRYLKERIPLFEKAIRKR